MPPALSAATALSCARLLPAALTRASCAAAVQVCTLSSLLPLPLLGLVPNHSGPEAQRKSGGRRRAGLDRRLSYSGTRAFTGWQGR